MMMERLSQPMSTMPGVTTRYTAVIAKRIPKPHSSLITKSAIATQLLWFGSRMRKIHRKSHYAQTICVIVAFFVCTSIEKQYRFRQARQTYQSQYRSSCHYVRLWIAGLILRSLQQSANWKQKPKQPTIYWMKARKHGTLIGRMLHQRRISRSVPRVF